MLSWKLFIGFSTISFAYLIPQDSIFDNVDVNSPADFTTQDSIELTSDSSWSEANSRNCLQGSSDLDGFQRRSASCPAESQGSTRPSTNRGIGRKIIHEILPGMRVTIKNAWQRMKSPRFSCPLKNTQLPARKILVTCTGPEVQSYVPISVVINCDYGECFSFDSTTINLLNFTQGISILNYQNIVVGASIIP